MTVYLICYGASWITAYFHLYYLSGTALMLAAGYLYYYDYHRTGNAIHLRGLFSAFWVGGQGIACLKLSRLQTDWSVMTWICFFLAFAGFWVTFQILERVFGEEERFDRRRRQRRSFVRPVYYCIIALTAVSLAAFLFEAAVLGFIPLFLRGVPHAYSEFHLSGIHYLTVSCVLVPALSVIFFLQGGSRRSVRDVVTAVCDSSHDLDRFPDSYFMCVQVPAYFRNGSGSVYLLCIPEESGALADWGRSFDFNTPLYCPDGGQKP